MISEGTVEEKMLNAATNKLYLEKEITAVEGMCLLEIGLQYCTIFYFLLFFLMSMFLICSYVYILADEKTDTKTVLQLLKESLSLQDPV